MDDTKVYAANNTSRSADGSGSEMRPMPRPTGGTITRGTPEQGADMYKGQQEQLRQQEEEIRKRALKIDPDNYTPQP